MASPRRLANPPIGEALIDVRVIGGAKDIEELAPLAKKWAPHYPQQQPLIEGEAIIRFKSSQLETKSRDFGKRGWVLRSADTKLVVQLRPNRLTFSCLPPYTTADALIDQAMALWSDFRDASKPDAVVRIAMRYINRMTLPFASGQAYETLLPGAPSEPPGMPSELSAFSTRMAYAFPDKIAAIVQQQFAGAPPKAPNFLLDIDVFQQGQFSLDASDLRKRLAQLREAKNRAFFSHLTDEAVKLFL